MANEPLEVRFSDHLRVAIDDDNILIANDATSAYVVFPRSYEERLNRYTDWRVIPDDFAVSLITEDGDGSGDHADTGASGDDADADADGTPGGLAIELEILTKLTEIGILDERTDDRSGRRLDNPGQAWDVAMGFLGATRTTRNTVFAVPEEYNAALAEQAMFSRQPSAYYERQGVPVRPLPDPMQGKRGRAVRFEDVMLDRRTARRFSDTAVTVDQLSKILFYGWGETGRVENSLGDYFLRKTSPSGGSLHPIEVYPIVMNVDGVESGLYHYSVRRHALEELAVEDATPWIGAAAGDQHWVEEAAVVFLCTAYLPRPAWKYHYARVARAVISEVGYTGQSAMLTSAWLGLGAFTTIALRDEIFEDKFGLDSAREPVLSITGVGTLEADRDEHARPRYETALGVPTS